MSANAEGSVNIALRAVDHVSSVFRRIGGSALGLGGHLNSLGDMAKIAGGMIAANLAMKAMGAVKQFVSGSIEAFAEFEDTLTTITAISGKVGAEATELYETLEETAHVAGMSFAVGANKAAGALESLVKAGMEGAEATEALNAALAMARIENMDTARASDLLVGVLNQFGYAAEEAGDVIDILVNASVKGIDTASGFATALGYSGATAKSLGFSLEETTAALVAINNQGIQAEKAGRYLNAMFSDMVGKSDKLGFSLYDSQGAMLDLSTILGKLNVKLQSFGTQAERDAYVNEVFGRQAARAVLTLLNLGDETKSASKALRELEAGMSASGTAMTVVGEKMDTFRGSQMKLSAAVEKLQIQLGEALAPVMRALADFLGGVVIPGLENMGKAVTAVWDAVKPFAEVLYWVATYVIQKTLVPAIETLVGWLKPLSDALSGAGKAIGDWWANVTAVVGAGVESIKKELGVVGEAQEELAESFGEGMENVADEVEENFSLMDLKAEETALTVEDMAGKLEKQFALVEAAAAENLSGFARQFDKAFSTRKFKEAAAVVNEFAEEYGIGFEKAEDIIEDFLEKQEDVPKTFREVLLRDAQDSFERFQNCVTGKARTLDTDVTGHIRDLASNISGLIRKGFVGEAQKQMEAYVNCSGNKVWTMVQDIEGYMTELTKNHNAELKKMKEYAETLTGQEKAAVLKMVSGLNAEYVSKMRNLEAWQEQLLKGASPKKVFDEMTGEAVAFADELAGHSIFPDLFKDLIRQSSAGMDEVNKIISRDLERSEVGFRALSPQFNIAGGIGAVAGPGPAELIFNAPLVVVEGNADLETVRLAADEVVRQLRSIVLEGTSSAASTKRIRLSGLRG